ncbi:MAG TPA: phenylalanine--tRNA ligase subunit beta, partial [Ignavibacteriales bacterium]|nr:phenylalanine--tRNA ligase subunit beta [Ignavibacteriales bacterium]
MSALRTSMLSGVLLTVSKNIKVGEKSLRLFEVGNVFEKKTSGEIKSFDDFTEDEKIIFVLTGKAVEAEWHAKDREYDIYDIKGCAGAFLKKFSLDKETNDSYYREEDKFLNEKIIRKHKETVIGFGGSVKKEVLKKFDIDQNVYVYEFDLKELKKLRSKAYSYTELLKYPKAVRDCAFIIEKDVTSDKVAEALKKGGSKL